MIVPLSVALWLAASMVATVPDAKSDASAPPPNPHPQCPYSDAAKKARADGTARVRLFITDEGEVSKVIVLHSSGNEAIDDSAVTCAKKFRFKPALWNGKPISSRTDYDFVFGYFSKQATPPDTSAAPSQAK